MNPLPPMVWRALVELQARCAEANWQLESVHLGGHDVDTLTQVYEFTTTEGKITVGIGPKRAR